MNVFKEMPPMPNPHAVKLRMISYISQYNSTLRKARWPSWKQREIVKYDTITLENFWPSDRNIKIGKLNSYVFWSFILVKLKYVPGSKLFHPGLSLNHPDLRHPSRAQIITIQGLSLSHPKTRLNHPRQLFQPTCSQGTIPSRQKHWSKISKTM